MKPSKRLTPLPTSAFIGLAALCIAVNSAQATDYTWDQNGAVAGTGGSGAWNTSSSFWNSGGGPTTWGNTSADQAIFGGTAGTVTTSGAITANKLTFQTINYTILGDVTLAETTPTIDTGSFNATWGSSTANATGSNILGSAGLTKTGAGTLTFHGAALTSTHDALLLGATTVTLSSIPTGLQVGSSIGGVGFAVGTFVQSIAGNVVTLSAATTAVVAANAATFGRMDFVTGGLNITNGTFSLGASARQNILGGNAVTLSNGGILESLSTSFGTRGTFGVSGITVGVGQTGGISTNFGAAGNGGRHYVLGTGSAGATGNSITYANITAGNGSTLDFEMSGGIESSIRAGSINIGSGTVTVKVDGSGGYGDQKSGNRVNLGNNITGITNIGTATAANQALLGSGTLNKTGVGALVLNSSTSAGTFSGTINVNGGSIRVAGADVLDGMSANSVNVASGAAIDLAVRLDATQLGKIGTLPSGSVMRWSTDSPIIGTTTNYTVVDGGILQIAVGQTGTKTITLGAGSGIEVFSSRANAGGQNGLLNLGSGTFATIDLAGNAYVGRSGTLPGMDGTVFSNSTGNLKGAPELRSIGKITETAAGSTLTKRGADVFTLGSAGNLSTYTGLTTVTEGTMRLNATDAIKSGNNITVNSVGNVFGVNATPSYGTAGLEFIGSATMIGQTFGELNGNGSISTSASSAGAVTMTVGSGNFSGNILNHANGTLSLAKNTSGTLTLSGINYYGGTTTISAGTLIVNGGVASALSSSGSQTGNATATSNIITGLTSTTGLAIGQSVSGPNLTSAVITKILSSSSVAVSSETTSASASSGTYTFASGGSGLGTGAVTVGASGTLGGSGTVGGATTIDSGGILAPTAQDSGSKLAFGSTIGFASSSIFDWTLTTPTKTDPGAVLNHAKYGQVAATGVATGTAVFKVTLLGGGTGSDSYADAFWNTNKSWDNVFAASGLTDLSALFTTFIGEGLANTGSGATAQGIADGRGYFSFTSTTLNWTAAPEPSGALATLLLVAGLLRRRRNI